MINFSLEFWIAVLLLFNFFVVVFLFFTIKKVNQLQDRSRQKEPSESESSSEETENLVGKYTAKVTAILEPLVEESRKTAIQFESQIKEKKRLIKELNDALDSRIININLLLSRADTQQKKLEEHQEEFQRQQKINDRVDAIPTPRTVDDQQQILDLYYQNIDVDTIARKLSIPAGEVQLVIDLKEKFLAMETDTP